MNTFKPGDTVRRIPEHRTGTWEDDDRPTTVIAFNTFGIRVDSHKGIWDPKYFDPVTPATTTEPAPSPQYAAGLYRDVDGRGWLHDVADGWYSVHAGGGVPVDPAPVDGDSGGWWDVDYPGFNDQDRATLTSFGLDVRVQVRRVAR